MRVFSIIYLNIITFFIFISFIGITKAQTNLDKGLSFSIEFINQYPNTKIVENKKGFKGRLVDLIFGKKQYVLSKPVAVYANNLDTFWILDQTNGTILQVRDKMGHIPQSAKHKIGEFASLVDCCLLPNGKFLFTDSQLNKIFAIDKNLISEFSADTSFKQTTGITYCEKTNTIWLVETAAHRISILDIDGNIIKQIGKRGSGNGEFNYPTAICSDKEGNIYVVDAMNFRVQIFSDEGVYKSQFGQLGDATGYFSRPKSIAIDSYEHIYVTDALFNTVQIFDKEGRFLYQFGKQGRDIEQFWMPTGIFIDKDNNIYVADSYNSRIQMFKLFINE